jgi:hypothetical protein
MGLKWIKQMVTKIKAHREIMSLICVGVLSGGEERGEIGSVQKIKAN